MNSRIGIVASALSLDVRQAVAAARECGFGGLQLDAVTGRLDLTTLAASGRREFRRILEQQDQHLIGLRAGAGAKGLGVSAEVDRLLWQWEKVLETAAGFAAPLVCLDVGVLPEPVETAAAAAPQALNAGLIILPTAAAVAVAAPQRTPPDAKVLAQVDGAMRELGRLADRYGVMVGLRSDLASLAALCRVLQAAACPMFGIDLDPAALLHEAGTVDQALSRVAGQILHVRGRDAVLGEGSRTRGCPIGGGSADWRGLMRSLDEAGFNGWITIDPIELTDPKAAAIAGLRYLRLQG